MGGDSVNPIRTFKIENKSWSVFSLIDNDAKFHLICRRCINVMFTNIICTQCNCNSDTLFLDIRMYETPTIMSIVFDIGIDLCICGLKYIPVHYVSNSMPRITFTFAYTWFEYLAYLN